MTGSGPGAHSRCAPCIAILGLALLTSPADAWTFTPGAPCILTHETADTTVTLTYDPSAPLYSITLTHPAGLPRAATFAITFDGPSSISIGTDRHRYHADGTALSVEDTGFGNVLNGLQFNHTMRARIGETEIAIPLAGAAEPTAAFRACKEAPPTA